MDLKLSLSNSHLKPQSLVRIRALGHIIQIKTTIINPNYLNLHLDLNTVRKPRLKKTCLVQDRIGRVVYLVRRKLTGVNLELIKNLDTNIEMNQVLAIMKISSMRHSNPAQYVNSDLRIAQML